MNKIDRARDHYHNDPTYHAMVDLLRYHIEALDMAPSEVREAAMFACLMVEERRPVHPYFIDAVGNIVPDDRPRTARSDK
jgi:hypothetical protein